MLPICTVQGTGRAVRALTNTGAVSAIGRTHRAGGQSQSGARRDPSLPPLEAAPAQDSILYDSPFAEETGLIGALIVTHGQLANELLNAARRIETNIGVVEAVPLE